MDRAPPVPPSSKLPLDWEVASPLNELFLLALPRPQCLLPVQ